MRVLQALLLICAMALGGLAPGIGAAQEAEDDGGMIVSFLESQLSGDGRIVQLTGFEGLLSSRATLEELTIADEDGVWFTLRNATLDWTRTALLRGRLNINTLSAEEVILTRLPPSGPDDAAPDAEATPFRLPELPVSIEIGTLEIDRISLGPEVLGQSVEGQLEGSISYSDTLTADLRLTRTDGQQGEIRIDVSYTDTPEPTLDIDVAFQEEAGGIVSNLLGIPGAPPLSFEVVGAGPLSDFEAQIDLRSGDTQHLEGVVRIAQSDTSAGDTVFSAELTGDLTGLLLPQAEAFFGSDISLTANGTAAADGTFTLEQLEVQTAAATLTGQLALDGQGTLLTFELETKIEAPEGDGPVALPGTDITLGVLDIKATYDHTEDDRWSADIIALQPAMPGASMERLALTAQGTIAPPGTTAGVTADLNFAAEALALEDAALATAIGTDITGTGRITWQSAEPLVLEALRLNGEDYVIGLDGRASISDRMLTLAGVFTTRFEDLSRFSDLAGRPLSGSLEGTLSGGGDPLGGLFSAELDLQGTGLSTGIAQIDPLIASGVRIKGGAARGPEGTTLNGLRIEADGLDVTLDGKLSSQASEIALDVALDEVERLVPALPGQATVTGRASRDGAEAPWSLDLRVTAPRDITASVIGTTAAAGSALAVNANMPDLGPLVPALPGPARVTGDILVDVQGVWLAELTAELPKDISATLTAKPQGDGARISYQANVGDVGVFVPQLPGPGQVTGVALSADMAIWDVTAQATLPEDITAEVDLRFDGTSTASFRLEMPDMASITPAFPGALVVEGTLEPGTDGPSITLTAQAPLGATVTVQAQYDTSLQAQIEADLPDVGALIPGLTGAISLSGTVIQEGDLYALNMTAQGPGNASTEFSGALTAQGTAQDITIRGSAPLALANRRLAPRAAFGTATYDLAINGPLSLNSVTGTIRIDSGRLTLPTYGKAINDINGSINLAGGSARVDLRSTFSDGGNILISGGVGLEGNLPADLTIALQNLQLRDGVFYDTSLQGQITVTGPLAGGALIAGQIDMGTTEVRLAETGLTFGGEIPENMRHIGEPIDVYNSRVRAGLVERSTSGSSVGGPAYGLDITIDAPGQIFIRGRGLDAEVSGNLHITGTTAAPVPEGRFDLVRGRLDLLGKRLTITEGTVMLAGDLQPALMLVASVPGPDLTAYVTISGTITAPEITFSSEPPLPEDEVLAQAFFGQALSDLSAFQAARLAGALAKLAGKGGGTLDVLRGGLGVADLDVIRDESGNTTLSIGLYLGENVYTDVSTDTSGETEIHLRIDLTEDVVVKGAASNSGETSLGIFFERDY